MGRSIGQAHVESFDQKIWPLDLTISVRLVDQTNHVDTISQVVFLQEYFWYGINSTCWNEFPKHFKYWSAQACWLWSSTNLLYTNMEKFDWSFFFMYRGILFVIPSWWRMGHRGVTQHLNPWRSIRIASSSPMHT